MASLVDYTSANCKQQQQKIPTDLKKEISWRFHDFYNTVVFKVINLRGKKKLRWGKRMNLTFLLHWSLLREKKLRESQLYMNTVFLILTCKIILCIYLFTVKFHQAFCNEKSSLTWSFLLVTWELVDKHHPKRWLLKKN